MRKRRFGFQWVWLLPLVAAVIGGWLAVRAVLADGPSITINFKTAEGLEAGRTRIKYKDVDVGVVKSITLGKDLAGVVVTAEMSKAAKICRRRHSFWSCVRIAGGPSRIGTLLRAAYGRNPGIDGEKSDSRPSAASSDGPPEAVSAAVHDTDRATGSPIDYRRLETARDCLAVDKEAPS